jgi:hypothetical protein
LLPVPGAALAQPADVADVHARAEEQFKQGIDARDKGDHRRALELFRSSHALEPGRGKVLNIALCEEQLGLFASAFKHFLEVKGQLEARDDRVPVVLQHLDAVSPKVPHLKLQLAASAPPGTMVTLDGAALAPASLGVESPVDPGAHVVTVIAWGTPGLRYEFTLSGGQHLTLEVTPQVAVPAQPAPEKPAPEKPAPEKPAPEKPAPRGPGWTFGVVSLGLGGASLLVGAATGGAAMAKRASTAPRCTKGPESCPASLQSDVDAYHRLGAASTATFVIGGALAATGVIVVATSRRGAGKRAAGAWIAPLIGPGFAGAHGGFR